jgi:hypothetical protein
MACWIVVYSVAPGTRETRSPHCPTERRALAQARTLHMQGCKVIRIDSPDGGAVPNNRLDSWIANGRTFSN